MPRTRKLDLDEVSRLHEQEDEAWQERLKDVARGSIPGFAVEIVPEEIPGYGVLPEREFKMRHLERVHALFNAVKHRLVEATKAAGESGADDWSKYVRAKRSGPIVRVFRAMVNGTPVPMPEAFVRKLIETQTRTSRSMPRSTEKFEGERRLVGGGSDGRESREPSRAS